MSFFSRFALTFNELSNATFNTLVVKAHKQSNEVNKEYVKLLQDPNFRTTNEVAEILAMSAEEARAELGISVETQPEAETSSN